jgi:hypothetical protein
VAQEFYISVTPLDGQKYLVRTERVAPGVPLAEEQVNWPVGNWLKEARQHLNDPLWGLFEGKTTLEAVSTNTEPETTNLVALGQALYRGLLGGALRDSWNCAQSIAHNRSEVLHLRLGLKDRLLPQLPWEVMHRGDRPLATGTDVVFSRYQPGTSFITNIRKVPVDQPLKILVAIAAPSDRESLELEEEYRHLEQELIGEQVDNGLLSLQDRFLAAIRPEEQKRPIKLDILRKPDREKLTQALERGQYQVFHYAGHSNWSTAGGELELVSEKTGLTESLSGDDLAGLLFNNDIQVAIFNSCRGAYSEALDSTKVKAQPNLAEAIVNRGVPGVLAMAERIPDGVSLAFAQLFYRHLAKGSASVTESLSRARQGLVSAYSSEQLYWALPVLYIHSEFDGSLLDTNPNKEEPKIDTESIRKQRERNLQKLLSSSQSQILPEVNKPKAKDLARSTNNLEYQEEVLPGHDVKLPIYGFESDDDRFESEELPPDDFESEDDDRSVVAEMFGEVTHSQTPAKSEAGGAIALTSPQKAPLAISGSGENTKEQPSASTTDKNAAAKTVKPRWRWPNPLAVGFPLMAAAMAIGTGLFLNRGPQPGDLLPSLPQEPVLVHTQNVKLIKQKKPVSLKATPTKEVTAKAIELLNNSDLAAARLTVESLLDRGALPEAKAALAVVPPELNNESVILFLQGRLAWEFVQRGNTNYSIEDARRYWEVALRQNPDSLEYLNALGFALYAEGDSIQAYQLWTQVTEKSNVGTNINFQPTATTNISPKLSLDKLEYLTAYAGIGLVVMKSAEGLPPEQQAVKLSKAIKFRQKVISDAPNFQPEELSRNWMWSEDAIRDWQLLLRM